MEALTVGNTAKLYCLNWIQQYAIEKDTKIKILDLGCGTALNFVNLLKNNPQIHYVGIEPSKKSCHQSQQNLKGLNAIVYNTHAYNVNRWLSEKFDIVVSFSAFEHVYRRMDYLRSSKEVLKEDGYFLINYDAGHFFPINELFKTPVRQFLASLGIEKYYQSFVKEKELSKMIDEIGFRIIEAKFFNSSLKEVYKLVPKHQRSEYMLRWLEFELYVNELGIDYTDSMANLFYTRNFILSH